MAFGYLQNLLSSGLPVLHYDNAAALWHGAQCARLEARGLRLMGCSCSTGSLRHDPLLITHADRIFVAGLRGMAGSSICRASLQR